MHASRLEPRLLLTMGDFVATCLTTARYHQELQAPLVFIYGSFVLAFLQLLNGWELFDAKKNAIHAIAHFLGGLMQTRMTFYKISSASYMWYIVAVVHLPASLVTLGSLAHVSRQRDSIRSQ